MCFTLVEQCYHCGGDIHGLDDRCMMSGGLFRAEFRLALIGWTGCHPWMATTSTDVVTSCK